MLKFLSLQLKISICFVPCVIEPPGVSLLVACGGVICRRRVEDESYLDDGARFWLLEEYNIGDETGVPCKIEPPDLPTPAPSNPGESLGDNFEANCGDDTCKDNRSRCKLGHPIILKSK